jgi:hypothetical protein
MFDVKLRRVLSVVIGAEGSGGGRANVFTGTNVESRETFHSASRS